MKLRLPVRSTLAAAIPAALILGLLFGFQAVYVFPGGTTELFPVIVQQTVPWLLWALALVAIMLVAERVGLHRRSLPAILAIHAPLGLAVILTQEIAAGALLWIIGLAGDYDLLEFVRLIMRRRWVSDAMTYALLAATVHAIMYVQMLKVQKAELRRSHLRRIEAVQALAGGLAHELNGALTVLAGHMETADRAPQAVVEAVAAMDSTVRATFDRIRALGQDLRAVGQGVMGSTHDFSVDEVVEAFEDAADSAAEPAIRVRHRAQGVRARGDSQILLDSLHRVHRFLARQADGDQVIELTVDRRNAAASGLATGAVLFRFRHPTVRLDPKVERDIAQPSLVAEQGRMSLQLDLPAVVGAIRQFGGGVDAKTGSDGTTIDVEIPQAPVEATVDASRRPTDLPHISHIF